jgi:hypothetical protein
MVKTTFGISNLPDKVLCSIIICLLLSSAYTLSQAQQTSNGSTTTKRGTYSRTYSNKRKFTNASSLVKPAPLPVLAKRPQNSMPDPDERILNEIFGSPGAVVAGTGFEPYGFQGTWTAISGSNRSFGMSKKTPGHLLGYSMHLYGSQVGVSDAEIYIPNGFELHTITGPTEKDAVYTFYYPELMGQKGITLAVFHVRNFGLRREGDRWRIGTTGGPGGDSPYYRHSHFELHKGRGLPFGHNERETLRLRERTRLHFRDFFCRQGTLPVNGVFANLKTPSGNGLIQNSFQASTGSNGNLLPTSLRLSVNGGIIPGSDKALTDIDAILDTVKALSNEFLQKNN